MAENTTPAQCTDEEWAAAKDAGLLFADPGSSAHERAIHAFGQAMYRRGYEAAINFIASGEAA